MLEIISAWLKRRKEKKEFKIKISDCKQKIKQNSNDPILYKRLGDIYKSMNRHKKAIEAYKNSLVLAPSLDLETLIINQYKKLGLSKANAYTDIGYRYMQNKLDDEAIKAFSEAIQINFKSAKKEDMYSAYTGVWEVYKKSKHYREAIEFFEKSNLKISYVYEFIAEAHYELEHYEKAYEAYKNALRTGSIIPTLKDLKFYLKCGERYCQSERYKEAREVYIEAIKVNSRPEILHTKIKEVCLKLYEDESEAYTNLGLIYLNLNLEKYAIDALKEAIRFNPESICAYINLGWAYSKLNNYAYQKDTKNCYKIAIKLLKKEIKYNPNNAKYYYWLGKLYVYQGKKDLATEQYSVLKGFDNELADDLFKAINL